VTVNSAAPASLSPLPFARPAIGEEEIAEVVATMRGGWLSLGPRTKQFEEEFARYIGVDDAVAVSSGSAALHLALLACGVGPGDEVITSTYTFASTALGVLHVGATPVLVDVEPGSLTIDARAVAASITSRTKAIIPVHFAGTSCAMDALIELARRHGLLIIEDAAHALPTRYRGQLVGTLGDVTVFSFYATKTLATGEGGMLTAKDPEVRRRVRRLSLHGMDADAWQRYSVDGNWRYDITAAGFKYNFTDLQAAIGIHQLRKLDAHAARREEIALRYRHALGDLPGLRLPVTTPDSTHAWHLFVTRFDQEQSPVTRDEAHAALRAGGIGTSVHFIPLHQFTAFRTVRGVFPVADRAFAEALSLPIYPGMSDADIERVIGSVRDLWSGRRP
jgi:dTDP-4-amino-4,6-dideoxygalactose transaminase